jgi:hypothetical protein
MFSHRLSFLALAGWFVRGTAVRQPPDTPPTKSRGLHAPLKNPSQGLTCLHARWKQAWAEAKEAP